MGGAERVMATLANEFVERGNEVLIVTMKDAQSVYKLDERVKIIGAGGNVNSERRVKRSFQMCLSAIKGIRVYIKEIKKFKPDIILSFLTNTNIMSIIVKKIYIRDIPLIISERCDPETRGIVTKKICELLYPKSDLIVCQSERVANYFLSINNEANVTIIPNPINDQAICKKTSEERKKIIVAVGRLNKQKNYELLINSFNKIKMKYPEYQLNIFGKGPEEDSLKCLIKKLDLENRVHLMGTKDNVMNYVYDSSLYVMSSNFEGFPNALIEAMGSGLPVICTDFSTGIARELIKDGVNGYVVPVNNPTKMAEAMSIILDNNSLQENMSRENKKIINTLNKSKIVDMWEKALNI